MLARSQSNHSPIADLLTNGYERMNKGKTGSLVRKSRGIRQRLVSRGVLTLLKASIHHTASSRSTLIDTLHTQTQNVRQNYLKRLYCF
jgi:hypothetical protein